MDLLDICEFLLYVTMIVYFIYGMYMERKKYKKKWKLQNDVYDNLERRMMEMQVDIREIRHILNEQGGRS